MSRRRFRSASCSLSGKNELNLINGQRISYQNFIKNDHNNCRFAANILISCNKRYLRNRSRNIQTSFPGNKKKRNHN